MKTSFFGYYPPSTEQYERLWKEGLIVLDTNVLLNLYRLPTIARDELIGVLELLKERLWIPHQVALEFQRRRLTAIASERKSTEETLSAASELAIKFRSKVDALQIEKRGLGIDVEPLLSDLEKANSQIIEAIRTAHASQLDISSIDPIRQRLDELLEKRVGPGPETQEELNRLLSDGEERYKEKIPPGFMDIDKEKNPNEASFIFDHIKYPRKFGDLILWKQLLHHVKTNEIKTILFVTADKKEDWWWIEQGKTIGPHPELVREIQRESLIDFFWMYSSGQFVEHANQYSAAKVSTESVAEIQQVAMSSQSKTIDGQRFLETPTELNFDQSTSHSNFFPDRPDMRAIEQIIGYWLMSWNDRIQINSLGFPDFIAGSEESLHGYEVKYLRQFDRSIASPSIANALLRGYVEINEGRLSNFSLIIVVPEDFFFDVISNDRKLQTRRMLARLLKKYPVTSIIVGTVLGNTFEELLNQQETDYDESFF